MRGPLLPPLWRVFILNLEREQEREPKTVPFADHGTERSAVCIDRSEPTLAGDADGVACCLC